MRGKIAVIGCGAIGRPWAIVFARAGYDAALYGRDADRLDAALGGIERELDSLGELDLLDGASPGAVLGRIQGFTDLAAAVDGALHVQENLPEDVAVKRDIMARLDALAGAGVPVASSTSGLPPSEFTDHVDGRARCLVAHPVNPPHLVPAVEVVPAPWTDGTVVERTRTLLSDVGQTPILVKRETPGFVLNRLQGALVNEAFRLVEDGYASPGDVDAAVAHGLGLRWSLMGPFETLDMNHPGGIGAFAAGFAPLFQRIAEVQADARGWSEAAVAEVVAARRAAVAEDEIPARQAWRDRRLAALAADKRKRDHDIGP